MNEIKRWEDLSKKDQKHLEDLLRKIEISLQEVEDTVKEIGINLPAENLEILRDDIRIHLPKGYFRKKKEFIRKYKLEWFIDAPILIDNVAYALQYIDFLNYMMSRFVLGHEGLSIGAVFRKYAVIHVMAVIEAIWAGFLEKIYKTCYGCEDIIPGCEICRIIVNRLKSKYPDHITLGVVSNILQEFSKEYPECIDNSYLDELNEFKEYRNRVHIQKYVKNEQKRVRDYFEDYSVDLYNQAINLLKRTPGVIENFYSVLPPMCFD